MMNAAQARAAGSRSPVRGLVLGHARVVAVAVFGALLLIGCGGAAQPTTYAQPGSAPNGTGAKETRLWIKDGGQTLPFENGRSVVVDGTDVEIYVSPFPPGRTANVDFYLTREGQAVSQANVTVQYDMTVMDHGPFQLIAVPTGRGHFLAPLDFAMSGDFWVNVSVAIEGRESIVNMLFRAAR